MKGKANRGGQSIKYLLYARIIILYIIKSVVKFNTGPQTDMFLQTKPTRMFICSHTKTHWLLFGGYQVSLIHTKETRDA